MYVCMYNVLCQSSHWLPYTINRIIIIIYYYYKIQPTKKFYEDQNGVQTNRGAENRRVRLSVFVFFTTFSL